MTYMQGSFQVQHGALNEANERLAVLVGKIGSEVDQLGALLSAIPQASTSTATDEWQARHQNISNAFGRLQTDLGVHTNTSQQIHDTFVETDNRGYRIMQG